MMCQKCNKNEATTYITKTINGVTTKLALCSDCAGKEGYSYFAPLTMGDLFGPIFGVSNQTAAKDDKISQRCKKCGTSFEEIVRDGLAGCAFCYNEFYDRLLPSIERIHGHAAHVGKLSEGASVELKAQKELRETEKQLKEAVDNQDYEKAATLRDKIKEMKGENINGESK